jgi:hypothetical protein
MLRASLFIGVAAILSSGAAYAQRVSIGIGGPANGLPLGTTYPVTAIDAFYAATRDGQISSATFNWSNAPCPAAVKIKFFVRRPSDPTFYFVEERGPFDVTDLFQTVPLWPPVTLTQGELIGIASLTSCGQPTTFVADPHFSQTIVVVNGDLKNDFIPAASNISLTAVSVFGGEDAAPLYLLGNRFTVTLDATDPRTGRRAIGVETKVGSNAGYFSLPDFTGDPLFPEVVVKMVDATASPPPFGGSFWFFYSSLTDVQYTLRVKDQSRLTVRVYTNIPGGPGQLCGGADTDAFRP